MLDAVLRVMPSIRKHIAHVSLGSPLSSNHFLGTAWGESYGLEHTARRFNATFLRPATPIPGLYLTGQDVVCDGVAGGAASAFLTASAIDWRVPLQNAGCLLAAMAATATSAGR